MQTYTKGPHFAVKLIPHIAIFCLLKDASHVGRVPDVSVEWRIPECPFSDDNNECQWHEVSSWGILHISVDSWFVDFMLKRSSRKLILLSDEEWINPLETGITRMLESFIDVNNEETFLHYCLVILKHFLENLEEMSPRCYILKPSITQYCVTRDESV